MKKIVLILLAAGFVLFVSAENSLACSCIISDMSLKKQVKKAYGESAAVFSGKVLEITESSDDEGKVLVRIEVGETWKGELDEEVTITTYKDGAMCGYYFEVGKEYIVYAYGTKDDLSTNNCSRTTGISNREDVKYLARLKKKNRKS